MWDKSKKYVSALIAMLITSLFILAACESGTSGSQRPRRRAKQFIREARVIDQNTISVSFRLWLSKGFQNPAQWKLSSGLKVVSVKNKLFGNRPSVTYIAKVSPPMKMGTNYKLQVGTLTPIFIDPDKLMDKLYSNKKMGMTEQGNALIFRVFVPRANKVKLCLFKKNNLETPYKEVEMKKDSDAVWEVKLNGKRSYYKQLYGYRIFGPEIKGNHFNSKVVIADPYSKATAQKNDFPQKSRTVILPPDYTTRYRWRSKKWTNLKTRDAIIYEVHVRDLTMHPTSRIPDRLKGTYLGFVKKLNHIKGTAGMNAVELLPVHDVGNTEPPYRKSVKMANGSMINNTWNPYSWNHWGYMNSSYFAVESMYATGYTKKKGAWNGVDGRQLKEFKQLVDACHARGISVILDVVYNHVSQYDYNPFKFIDYKYYFRKNAKSGCGNDFKTERPMARKMIIDSLKYFVKECHVDGFRFDLAAMIDHKTIVEIKKQLPKIHPNVILIAEPWGGGSYNPQKLSSAGWASWNDRFRNVVKGNDCNANGGGGSFIYGKSSGSSLKPVVMGTLKKNGGLFDKIKHAINYLASHDNHSLGDHVRIDSGRIGAHDIIPEKDVDKLAQLNEREKKIHKLAAMILYTSQGGVMVLAGQEWAQAKVVHPPKPAVSQWASGKAKPWTLDHDSYEKDNETNWLNYKHMRMNMDLVNYYMGLSMIRRQYEAFRWANESDISWINSSDNYKAIGWKIRKRGQFIVLVNGDKNNAATFKLPPGNWRVLADGKTASASGTKSGQISIPATSGMILKK